MISNKIQNLITKSTLIISFIVVIISSFQCAPEAKIEIEDPDINGLILYRYNGSTIIDSFKAIDYTSNGTSPIIPDTIKLSPNTTYNFKIKFFSYNPITKVLTDITSAIRDLGNEHEVFYVPSTNNIAITKTDTDSKGFPLGFNSTWASTTASNLNVGLFLRHIPSGKTNNSTTNASLGDNDITITFPTVIK